MQNKDKGDGIEDSPLDMLLVILLEGASKEVVMPSSASTTVACTFNIAPVTRRRSPWISPEPCTIREHNQHRNSLKTRTSRASRSMAAVILEPTTETETLIWEREGNDMCLLVITQSNWLNLVKQSTLVKYSTLVKDWSKERDLTANIDIFRCLCKIGLQN